MDRQILEFLFRFFRDQGDITQHHNLADILQSSNTVWSDQSSIDEIWGRINRMQNFGLISIEHSDFNDKDNRWGIIPPGETVFDYRKRPVMARIEDKGIELIQNGEVSESVINTNRSVQKVNKWHWLTAVIAGAAMVASIRSCQVSKEANQIERNKSQAEIDLSGLKYTLKQKENALSLLRIEVDSLKNVILSLAKDTSQNP